MILKTQFEIRYTPILDFNNIYKTIFSPFLKMSEFSINNSGTYEEFIVLNFPEDKIYIDCRWDRIFFVFDGKKDNLYDSNGITFTFFNILKKITEQNSFGKITHSILGQWTLIESQQKQDDILREFKNRYLKNMPVSTATLEDLMITLNYKEKEKQINISFGLFKPEKDIKNYNLFTVSKNINIKIDDLTGILTTGVASCPSSTYDLATFKRLEKSLNEVIKQISI